LSLFNLMPVTAFSNQELLQMIRHKTKAGAAALYDQHAQVLSLAIFRIVQQRSITDILLQKAVAQIWDTANQYNENELPLLAWMLAISKNVAQEYSGRGVE